MRIAHCARPVQIVLQIVLLAGAHADFTHQSLRREIAHEGDPRLAGRGTVGLFGEPAVLHAGDERIGEHGGARSLPQLSGWSMSWRHMPLSAWCVSSVA